MHRIYLPGAGTELDYAALLLMGCLLLSTVDLLVMLDTCFAGAEFGRNGELQSASFRSED